MSKFTSKDFEIQNLGHARFPSPLQVLRDEANANFVSDTGHRVLFEHSLERVRRALEGGVDPITIERSGPREKLYFDPAKATCAIVTCGGLCPGLNDVIRGLVMTLSFSYGVKTIYGIPYGYEGFINRYGHPIRKLTPDFVSDIHTDGGSVLGTSRGHQSPQEMVDKLVELEIDILFVIGGDGTLRGASARSRERARSPSSRSWRRWPPQRCTSQAAPLRGGSLTAASRSRALPWGSVTSGGRWWSESRECSGSSRWRRGRRSSASSVSLPPARSFTCCRGARARSLRRDRAARGPRASYLRKARRSALSLSLSVIGSPCGAPL